MERRDDTRFDPFAAFDLSGKVAVVTGAASGIGEAAVRTFAAAGAAVMLADVDEVGTQRVLDDLRREGARASSLRVDTRVRGDLDAVVERAVTEFGSLDILTNIAGVGSYGSIEDADEAEVDRAFAINFKGPLFGCQAALRVMRPQRSGSIVNVSATAINVPAKGVGIYAATKAAVAMLTQTLIPRRNGGRVPAAELLILGYGARQHIRKNALQHLHQEITITRKQGSFTLEESLAQLVFQQDLLREEAMTRALHPEDLDTILKAKGF